MEKNEIRNLRIILIIFAILHPLSAYRTSIGTEQLYNPMWYRIVISALLCTYFVATFFSEKIRNNSRKISLLTVYSLTFFQIYLAYLNNFNPSFINGYVLMAMLGILYIKGYRQVFSYSIFTFLFLVLLYFVLKSSEMEIRGGSVIGMAITNLLLTMLKVYILNKEFSVIQYSKQLNNSEQKFKKLLESAPNAIITINKKGEILSSNIRSKKMFSNEKLEGSSITSLFPQRIISKNYDYEKLKNEVSKLSESDINKSLYCITKTGIEFPVELSFSKIENDGEGGEEEYIIIIKDISLRKNTEKELLEMKQRLHDKELIEKVSKAKSEFISKISHEIRTPLTSIIGFSNLLIDENLNDNQTKYLKSIKFSSQLLNSLINDILDNSNIESNQLNLESDEIDLKILFSKVLDVFKINVEAKNLKIQLNYSSSFEANYIVKSDALRLSQIFMNLISNAIKFSYENEVVEIHVDALPIDDEKLDLIFSVTNSGIGIPADKLDEIFHPYIQGSNEISKKYGGNGLGLSIVKNLLEKLNGTIKVVSDSKTTFTIQIPLEKFIDKQVLNLNEHFKMSTDKNFKILVVEDDEFNQFLIETIFEKYDINFTIVENGQEALSELMRQKYNLILMDLMMPIMDGYTCTKIIRKELNINIPIILFTADVKSKINKELKGMYNGYVKKPFNEMELLNLIDNCQN